MALEEFEAIREALCTAQPGVTPGKMMSSPAVHYKGKVFAFFSTKQKMVFKLGKDFPIESLQVKAVEFNPFTNRKPLTGWYEVAFEYRQQWLQISKLANWL